MITTINQKSGLETSPGPAACERIEEAYQTASAGAGWPGGAGPEQPGSQATVELFEKAVAALHSQRHIGDRQGHCWHSGKAGEDVVQQAVTNLFQHHHRYDWREPGGLLKRAVVNESLRLLRHPRMAMVAEEHPDTTETPIEEMVENEAVHQLRTAIAKLPDHFRAALVLCEYENLSYAQVAQAMNASVPQVQNLDSPGSAAVGRHA